MRLSRRSFVTGSAAVLAAPYLSRPAHAAIGGGSLQIPPLIDASREVTTLDAIAGTSTILDGVKTPTWGFSQAYLGPVLRFPRGKTAQMRVRNRLNFPITCHWHGLHVPAIFEGGPHLLIPPGDVWKADLPVDQPAATLWYHSHVHGSTAEHVYGGLSGLIIVDDPDAVDPNLPNEYGVDDLPLIIQDRAFDPDGRFYYVKRGPILMHGFRGNIVLVNGAITPTAHVPAGIVRLRLLNGSNARIYRFRFSDSRTFHQIASDGGLLPKPIAQASLTLAPAERAELLVDFEDAKAVRLLSGPDDNSPMGMMRGMMGGVGPGQPPQTSLGRQGEFEIMRFSPNKSKVARLKTIPDVLATAPRSDFGDPSRTRTFRLDMHAGMMGGGGMGRGMGPGRMGRGPMGRMGINEAPYDPKRIDVRMRLGETELWQIFADEMAHPFHVHGTSFRVLSRNGRSVPYDDMGLKDVLLVDGRAEILVQVNHPATSEVPFMHHCHILEHEDAGMMGQFTVA